MGVDPISLIETNKESFYIKQPKYNPITTMKTTGQNLNNNVLKSSSNTDISIDLSFESQNKGNMILTQKMNTINIQPTTDGYSIYNDNDGFSKWLVLQVC